MIASLLLVVAAVAQAPDTTRYIVLNHGRLAGDMTVMQFTDSVVVRYQHIDRNRGQWLANVYRLRDGRVVAGESRPMTRDGWMSDANETFEIGPDSIRWRRGRTQGATANGGFHRLNAATPFEAARIARYLLSQPDHAAELPPAGRAELEVVADTVVETTQGPRRVRLVEFGRGFGLSRLWLDENDELFATNAAWFITLAPKAQPALPVLRSIERAHLEARAAEVARRLMPSNSGPIAITNANLFDSETGEVRPGTTIVVRGDRIEAVGSAASVQVPADAAVVDAAGKTVMPGLWDMHTHLQFSSQTGPALLQLASGITTIRDLAADEDAAVSQRDRAAAGEIVSPRLILGGFIEGPGAWAGPTGTIVRTEAEARAWVARYDSMGYRQIKLYNLLHPDLVPTIAEEAHRRGLRLSGHVPRGISVPAAVRLGFDEINHAAFLFSTFFQDSLYVPEMRPYSGVAATVAPSFDVDGDAMTSLIDVLREHGTVVDGTFGIWMGGAGALQNQGTPAAESYRKLIRRLWEAGVTLVPGTDNFTSSTLTTELQLYEQAGIPAPEVLRIATIVPARVMGDDEEYGSIAPGKVADLIIVDGRPYERVADLQRVEQVMRAGRLFQRSDLLTAVNR